MELSHTDLHAFAGVDKVSFEFRSGSKDIEDELTTGRSRH